MSGDSILKTLGQEIELGPHWWKSILQYLVRNDDGRLDDVEVQKHGNARSTNPKPFYPLKKSMLAAMKESIVKKGSQGVYNDLRRRQVAFLGLLLCLNYHVGSSRYTTQNQG